MKFESILYGASFFLLALLSWPEAADAEREAPDADQPEEASLAPPARPVTRKDVTEAPVENPAGEPDLSLALKE